MLDAVWLGKVARWRTMSCPSICSYTCCIAPVAAVRTELVLSPRRLATRIVQSRRWEWFVGTPATVPLPR